MKQDARKLTHEGLTELRKRVLASVQAGESPEVVARVFGVSRQAVYGWLALYRSGGWDKLEAGKRGGRKPKLDGKAMRWIYQTVTMKNPLQLKFTYALWTAKMLGELIAQRFKVELSKASVCRLLGQLGLSPQRPVWRAYQQQPEAVQKWLDEEYPEIRLMAKREKAQIFFGDEAGVRSDHHAGTTWAPRGQTPVVSSTGARFSLNLISAVSAQGEMRFMVVDGTVGSSQFIEFIKRLLHNAPGKIFLIVDGHPSHKAKMVQKFVESVKDRFRLFFLPPYSPELNPDERVWNDLKNNRIGRTVVEDKVSLKAAVIGCMRSIQKNAERIRGYFNNESTRYAAV